MIRAILVDDEQKSLLNLEMLLTEYCKDIEIINKANNAMEAVKLILEEKPDVVFLDVQMPGYSGFDVMDNIKTSAKIIFTTAHKDYAINAIRKGAFDYLLKPIDIEDLKNCVDRVIKEIKKDGKTKSTSHGLIELFVKDGIIFIKPNDIIRIEASGSYTLFYLENNLKHMGSKSMKEYEIQLDQSVFYRCHNSHIINLTKVTKFVNHDGLFAELSDGSRVEIARKNKDEFLDKLKGN